MQSKTQQQLDDEAAEAKKKRAGPKRRKVTHGRIPFLLALICGCRATKTKTRIN